MVDKVMNSTDFVDVSNGSRLEKIDRLLSSFIEDEKEFCQEFKVVKIICKSRKKLCKMKIRKIYAFLFEGITFGEAKKLLNMNGKIEKLGFMRTDEIERIASKSDYLSKESFGFCNKFEKKDNETKYVEFSTKKNNSKYGKEMLLKLNVLKWITEKNLLKMFESKHHKKKIIGLRLINLSKTRKTKKINRRRQFYKILTKTNTDNNVHGKSGMLLRMTAKVCLDLSMNTWIKLKKFRTTRLNLYRKVLITKSS